MFLQTDETTPKWSNRTVRPCPHDTFPNRARSIANGSRPVARVHTGETGTLVPVSSFRFLKTTLRHGTSGRERSRSVAPCRVCRVDARVGARVRSPNHPLLSHASLTYFLRDLCNCYTGHPHTSHPQIVIPLSHVLTRLLTHDALE